MVSAELLELLFLYRKLEFSNSLEEAKYLEVSGRFFWDRVYSATVVSIQGTGILLTLGEAKYL
jgi:hypothetical protein